jgi:uncharacterized surface protein with fasciclin (FAS1) repeats
MKQAKWHRRLAAPLVAALLFSVFAPVTLLAQDTAAAQQTKAAEVTGTLTGGQFAKIWLGLTPINPGTVTVRAEWDRPNAAENGLGFYILDESNLAAVVNGAPLPANNVGVGNSNFYLNGPSNVQGSDFRATGPAYTVVVFNDSATDANFTLSATNGLFVDDANQVRVVGEAETPAAETGDAAAAPAATDAVTTTVAAAPAATEAAAAATPAAAATTAVTPSVAAVPAGPVRATTMQGELPEQFDQHFLALEPEIKDGEISLELTYDPQDSTELARRINFWVLDQSGFTRYQAGDSPGSVAIAAGSKSFLDPDTSNKRVAAFKAVGFGPYTVIVQNNSRVPATYNLGVTGGILIDDSAQTLTAQQAGATAPGAAATGTTTDTAAATTTTATTTTTTTTTTAGSGVVGEPGGTYVVQSGDTLAIIARDIYGDFRLYEQICAFNNIADCNVIEVGQTINLPTTAQIGATATTAAAATPAATTAAAATPAAAAATPAATVAVTSAVTTTAAVTTTTAATTTAATRPAATTATTGTAATTTAAGTIVDIAEDNGNFAILLEALGATDLDAALGGSGPFTVFAPTDAAFNSLLSGNGLTKDQLLQAKELADILQYHVLSGKVLAADVTNGLKATTLQGKPVTFEVKDGKVFINGAEIVTTDIQASNGVIHAIDAVILPPQ